MPTWGWILIAIGAAVVIAAFAWGAYRKRRSARLQDTFGAEYDRTVADAPTRREAEADLAERERRRGDGSRGGPRRSSVSSAGPCGRSPT